MNQTSKIKDKVQSLHTTIDQLNEELTSLNQTLLNEKANTLLSQIEKNRLVFVEALDAKLVKDFMDTLKTKSPETLIFGIFKGDEKLNMACYVPKAMIEKGLKAGQIVKEAAQIAGGNGGGKPDFAQAGAKDFEKIGDSLSFVRQKVDSLL